MTLLLVAVGAAVGAPLRYLVDRAIQARHDAVFPCGTFTVNVTGSLILGALAGAAAAHDVPGSLNALVGVGLCGALTTYSTFGYETIRLVETGARPGRPQRGRRRHRRAWRRGRRRRHRPSHLAVTSRRRRPRVDEDELSRSVSSPESGARSPRAPAPEPPHGPGGLVGPTC